MNQQIQCPNCGAPLLDLRTGARKCEYCGKRLKVSPTMVPPAPQSPPQQPPHMPMGGMPRPAPAYMPPPAMPQYQVQTATNPAVWIVPVVILVLTSLGGIVPVCLMAGGAATSGLSRSTSGRGATGGGDPAGPAQLIQFGETKNGHLNGPTTTYQDYILNIPSPTKVRIDMVGQGIDSHLDLLDGNNTLIATDDDGGRGLDSRIARALPAGRYTVRAKLHSVHQSGGYLLSLVALGLGSGQVRQLQPGTAVSTVLGPPSSRRFGPEGPFFDEYAFPIIMGQTLRVSAQCESCHITIVIEDQAGNVITGDPSRAQYRQADALLTGVMPGTYIARISSREHSPWMGPYILTLTDGAAMGGTTMVTTLAPGLVVYGIVSRPRRGTIAEYNLLVPAAAGPAPMTYTVFLSTEGNSSLASGLEMSVLNAANIPISASRRVSHTLIAETVLVPGQAYRILINGRRRRLNGTYMLGVARPIP